MRSDSPKWFHRLVAFPSRPSSEGLAGRPAPFSPSLRDQSPTRLLRHRREPQAGPYLAEGADVCVCVCVCVDNPSLSCSKLCVLNIRLGVGVPAERQAGARSAGADAL